MVETLFSLRGLLFFFFFFPTSKFRNWSVIISTRDFVVLSGPRSPCSVEPGMVVPSVSRVVQCEVPSNFVGKTLDIPTTIPHFKDLSLSS